MTIPTIIAMLNSVELFSMGHVVDFGGFFDSSEVSDMNVMNLMMQISKLSIYSLVIKHSIQTKISVLGFSNSILNPLS